MQHDRLLPHQRENVNWVSRVERGLLADEPGLGKSRSAIEGAKALGARNVLIVAPKLVLEAGVWDEEVERWGDDDTRYAVATYHQLNRRKPTAKGGLAPVKVLADGIKPTSKNRWDMVIVDEAHYIKGRDSKWTWAVKQLARSAPGLMLLTGTPIPNWAHEVFTLLQCLYPEEGKIGNEFGGFWRWADQWFDTDTNYASGNPRAKTIGNLRACNPACYERNANDPCSHYTIFAEANFGDHYMRHLRADNLVLPPLTTIDVPTPLDAEGLAAYRSLRKDFAATVGGEEVLAWTSGARHVLLDKLTTSPWLLHKKGEPHGGKLDYLRADLVGRDAPTVVFAHYRDSVEAAARVGQLSGKRAAYIHGGTTDRSNAAAIRDFKAGRLDLLVGSLETMAEGITVTIADQAIFLERSYKPSRNIQATYRIYRLGQENECLIRRYLTPKTVDIGKEKLLNTKTDRQMRTLTAADYLRVA